MYNTRAVFSKQNTCDGLQIFANYPFSCDPFCWMVAMVHELFLIFGATKMEVNMIKIYMSMFKTKINLTVLILFIWPY